MTCLEWLIVNNDRYKLNDIPQHKIEVIWRAAQIHYFDFEISDVALNNNPLTQGKLLSYKKLTNKD